MAGAATSWRRRRPVIAWQQAHGSDRPWLREDFVDLIVRLQQQRQTTPVPTPSGAALRPVAAVYASARVLPWPIAFLVRPLGFIEPTAARRISYADSLAFEQVHQAVYREHGFELVDVPASTVPDCRAGVEAHLAAEEKLRWG